MYELYTYIYTHINMIHYVQYIIYLKLCIDTDGTHPVRWSLSSPESAHESPPVFLFQSKSVSRKH